MHYINGGLGLDIMRPITHTWTYDLKLRFARYKDLIDLEECYDEFTKTPCRCRLDDFLVRKNKTFIFFLFSQRLLPESDISLPQHLKQPPFFLGYLIAIPKPPEPKLRSLSFSQTLTFSR